MLGRDGDALTGRADGPHPGNVPLSESVSSSTLSGQRCGQNPDSANRVVVHVEDGNHALSKPSAALLRSLSETVVHQVDEAVARGLVPRPNSIDAFVLPMAVVSDDVVIGAPLN